MKCPFCTDKKTKTPSVVVETNETLYKCAHCGVDQWHERCLLGNLFLKKPGMDRFGLKCTGCSEVNNIEYAPASSCTMCRSVLDYCFTNTCANPMLFINKCPGIIKGKKERVVTGLLGWIVFWLFFAAPTGLYIATAMSAMQTGAWYDLYATDTNNTVVIEGDVIHRTDFYEMGMFVTSNVLKEWSYWRTLPTFIKGDASVRNYKTKTMVKWMISFQVVYLLCYSHIDVFLWVLKRVGLIRQKNSVHESIRKFVVTKIQKIK